MKKLLASVLVIVSMMLCAASHAWADGILGDWKKYGDWNVSLDPVQSDISSSRMYAVGMDERSWMLIAFLSIGGGSIFMTVDPGNFKFPGAGKAGSGEMRVGNGKTHKVRFTYFSKNPDGKLGIQFEPESGLKLIQEASRAAPSDSIRIKIKMGGRLRSWVYPLNGFNEALERCLVVWE